MRIYVHHVFAPMHITSYLPDEPVGSLDRLAREQRCSRSAVIRLALEAYLQRQQAGAWPQRVREWDGDPDFPAFESLRGAEQSGGGDPFERGVR